MPVNLTTPDRYEWEATIRSIHPRATRTCPPDAGHLPFPIKSLLLLMGTYAADDGSSAAPGDAWLTATVGRCNASIRRWRVQAVDMGLLRSERRGGAPGDARRVSEYRLTLPADPAALCMVVAGHEPITGRMRMAVARRDDNRCRYCGEADGPFEIDHVVPLSLGGGSGMDNLVWACSQCNRRKRTKLWVPRPLETHLAS